MWSTSHRKGYKRVFLTFCRERRVTVPIVYQVKGPHRSLELLLASVRASPHNWLHSSNETILWEIAKHTSTWCYCSPGVLIWEEMPECGRMSMCMCIYFCMWIRVSVCGPFPLARRSHTFVHGWISTHSECFISFKQTQKLLWFDTS